MSYEITQRQSTFWDFTGQDGVSRVHFIAKSEADFVHRFVSSFVIEANHPLLMNYISGWSHVFTTSAAVNAGAVLRRVDEAIRGITEGWRSLTSYRTEDDAFSVLSASCGSLMTAPEPVCSVVSTVLESEGIRFNLISAHAALGSHHVLVADKSWVIAESFRIEELPLNKALKNDARKNARAS